MNLFNDRPGVPRKLSFSDQDIVRSRIDRMVRALSTGVSGSTTSALPSACIDELAHVAQDLAGRYRLLISTGLTNMQCGLTRVEVSAIADEASLAYQRTIITLCHGQMEKHMAAGASRAALAAVYGSILCGLHLAANRASINVRAPDANGTSRVRTVSVKALERG